MADQTKFGPIVSGDDVEQAVVTTLKKWLPTYMHYLEDIQVIDRNSYPGIKSYTTKTTFDTIPGDDFMPMIVVVSPGLNSVPVKDGEGMLRASWSLGVVVVVTSNNETTVRKLVMTYAAAIRLCLSQKRDLEGFSRGTIWEDEGYDDIPTEESRSIMAARLYFSVEVDEVSQVFNGPLVPDDFGDWPLAQPPIDIQIEKEAV